MKKETTLQRGFMEEVYCYWFGCSNCGHVEVQAEYLYCPMCGAKIKDGETDRVYEEEERIEKENKIKAKKAEIKEKEEELSKLRQ